MKSTVYFIDFRAGYRENIPAKIDRLLNTAGLSESVQKRDLIAIKLHFGEAGNAAFIRPVYVRKIVEAVKGTGGIPFLTDCNTLYTGARRESPHHITTAIQNGFAYPVVGAPIIIADGLRGKSDTQVTIHQKRFEMAYLGSDIANADGLVSAAHFKCHELAGFGGTLKNLGMGCASRRGKLALHSVLSPKVKRKRCLACGNCIDHCPAEAIAMFEEKARIDQEACIGCAECIARCPNEAIRVRWNRSIPVFMENVVEYAMAVLQGKKDKALFLNFITDVTPTCDCEPFNDAAIVRDIGITASKDPVAIDQASVDLVNAEQALQGSCLEKNLNPGEDKIRGLYPEVDWTLQLDYAEGLNLGSRNYELVRI